MFSYSHRWLRIIAKQNIALSILGVAVLSCSPDESPMPATFNPNPVSTDEIQPVLLSQDFAMDSIKLRFSEPVQVEFIKSTSDSYDLVILNDPAQVRYSFDSTTIKFRCIPCQLGRDYDLQYAVRDTAGNQNKQPFTVSYYSERLDFPRISDFSIEDNKQVGYVISLFPNKLTAFSLTTYKINFEIALDFLPSSDGDATKCWKFTHNPFNGCLYIYSNFSKSIFVYSLEERRLLRTFELPAENIYVPEYSSVYPMDIAFTSSGAGLVNTVNQWGNGGLLRTINSTRADTSQVIGPMDAGLMFSIRANGDNSKIFLISEHAPFYYYSSQTNNLSAFSTPDPETNFTFFVPNRKNDFVYMAGHQAQFIIDHVNETRTSASYLGLPVAGDFSYAPGEESNFAYLVDNSKLWLLNYEKRKTEFGWLINDIINIENLVNTVDGRTMVIQHRSALILVDLTKLRRKNL